MKDLIGWPPTWEEVLYFVKKKREWHQENPTQRVWNPNHNLVGAIGEFHFGLRFGLKPDLKIEPKRPFYIDFRTPIGSIDVKSTETKSDKIHLLRQVKSPTQIFWSWPWSLVIVWKRLIYWAGSGTE